MTLPRLLLVTHFAPPDRGGIERFLNGLVHAYREYGGWIAGVLPEGRQLPVNQSITASLFPWRWMRPSYLPLLWQLPRWVRAVRAETVLFGHASNALLVPAVLSWFGLRYVVLVHGMDVRMLPRWAARFALRRAQVVLVNSNETRRVVEALGVGEGCVGVCTPGTIVTPLPGSRLEPAHGLAVGRLVHRKGFSTLIEAMAQVHRVHPEIRLTIVGEGPERAALENLVQALGLGPVVTLAGNRTDADLHELRNRVGWSVLVPEPTGDPTDVEGFGMVLQEAQAYGLPVVTAEGGGVGDAVSPEGSIRVTPRHAGALADAISQLLEQPDRTASLARNARRWAEGHTRWSDRAQILAIACAPDLEGFGPIAIVIPAYNSERTIVPTLVSVRAQRGVRTEVVVVNDGSTDATAASVRTQGVRLVQQPNAGAPAARNHGVRETSAPFLFFCDADVRLQPYALRDLLRSLLLHPGAAYAYCSFRFGLRTHRCGPFSAERLRGMNYITTMSLVRRERFPGFDASIPRLQDWDLWLTMLERGDHGVWVPRYLFTAIPRGRGISGRMGGPPPRAAVERIRKKHQLL